MKYLMITLSLLLLLSGCKWGVPLVPDVPGEDYNVLHYVVSTEDPDRYVWGFTMRNYRAEPIEFDINGDPIFKKDNGIIHPGVRYKTGMVMSSMHDQHLEIQLARYAEAYVTIEKYVNFIPDVDYEEKGVTVTIFWNGEVVAQETASGEGTVLHLIWDER